MNNITGNLGPAGAQYQRAPTSDGPLIDAVNTMARLELGIIGLEPNLVLTSIAISLRRIAEQLQMIAGNQHYTTDRTNSAIKEIAEAIRRDDGNKSHGLSELTEVIKANLETRK